MTNPRAFANLATVMPDGSPHVTPIWFDFTAGMNRVNTARGRVKARNMANGARVALSIVYPDDAYGDNQVRSEVVSVTEDDGKGHLDGLARKYLGMNEYLWHNPQQVRVIYEIEPRATSTQTRAYRGTGIAQARQVVCG